MQIQDFNTLQNQAVMMAKEMHKRAIPPDSEKINTKQQTKFYKQTGSNQHSSFFGSLFGGIFDNDITLILGLILLLSGDGGDRMLLLALVYIMS